MSVIPNVTQIKPMTQSFDLKEVVHLIWTPNMPVDQAELMKECLFSLKNQVPCDLIDLKILETLSRDAKFFVIPTYNENLINKIQSRFSSKAFIYTARASLQARRNHNTRLPTRSLTISLSMYDCRVFLVKTLNVESMRHSINSLSGTIMAFKKITLENVNVVITDRSDNRYCQKAQRSNIPVVSKDWVDYCHSLAKSGYEPEGYNALSALDEYRVKPFHGLHFRIENIRSDFLPLVKKLIIENQGKIVYGNENCLTHIVSDHNQYLSDSAHAEWLKNRNDVQGLRFVDLEFLEVCSQRGCYLTKEEYCLYIEEKEKPTTFKQEPMSQQSYLEATYQAPDYSSAMSQNIHYESSENQSSMPPPPTITKICNAQRQPATANDLISKAFSAFDKGVQTQLASTQMRRMPETAIHIEQTFEPSQQLFWSESKSNSRR